MIKALRRLSSKINLAGDGLNFFSAVNLARNYLEFKRKKTFLKSYPRYAAIEIINYCNLACPHCALGSKLSPRPKSRMPADDFYKTIDQLSGKALVVNLGPNGEPFLHPDICRFIAYARRKGLAAAVFSNFNLPSGFDVAAIVNAGLHELVLGIDGATASSYNRYRINGDFNKVIRNIKELVAAKKGAHSPYPQITWQYIIMRHNQDEIPLARRMAVELGIDKLTFDTNFIPLADYWYFYEGDNAFYNELSQWHPTQSALRVNQERIFMENCNFASTQVHILVDGSVVPCCRLAEKNVVMGNLHAETFRAIWNSPNYIAFRKQLFDQGKKTKCHTCLLNARKMPS